MKKRLNNFNSSRRGQVTIFVILGIVILLVIVFAIAISSSLSKIKLQSEANKAVNAYLQSEAVNYYVYTCMDSAVTSSIFDLAIQGGVFYDYQNDTYIASEVGVTHVPYSTFFMNNTGDMQEIFFNVSYSILNHSYCSIVQPEVPEYPLNKSHIGNLFAMYNDFDSNGACLYDANNGYALSGFAGFNNMTRLCEFGSNNTRSIKSKDASVEFSPCYNSITTDENKSIEHILARQINIRMANCTDFSVFKDDNITVFGLPQTRVIYTADSVLVESTYNLTVKIKNKEPVIVKHTFSYKTDLRLARLHNYVMSLIRADSQDFFFNIKTNNESYDLHNELNPERFFDKDNMEVQVLDFVEDASCINCEYKFDHILIVEDRKSMIGNRPLIYMTMIKNRLPALEFIHLTESADAYYDIIVSDAETITLNPQGYDPDDENLSYLYEGWKETYDESCSINLDEPPNPDYLLVNAQCTKYPDASLPVSWTHSSLFTTSKRAATYHTDPLDKGPHEVKISTKDTSGLYDYQIVRILVFDLPKAVITPIHLYDDAALEEDTASLEDYLTLDGSSSTTSSMFPGIITKYTWTINKLSPLLIVFGPTDTAESSIEVPATIDYNLLIQTIKPNTNFGTMGDYEILLTVESNTESGILTSAEVPRPLTIKECVPHYSSNPSFPFNVEGSNPFYANHACCNADYTLKSGDICYTEEKYGELDTLKDLQLSNNYKLSEYPFAIYLPSSPVVTVGKKNDVYHLTFNRACDGNRGNVCAGTMTSVIEIAESCAIMTGTESESCTGPPNALSDSPVGCETYTPGNSYEKTFDVGGANGICNEVAQCSTFGANGYNAGGIMRCKATCNDGSCKNIRSQDCSCDRTCGAQCDATLPALWSGTTCSYSCNANSCTFSTKTLPCTSGNSYCYSSSGTYANYCYSNVVCNANTANSVKGEYCNVGTVVPSSNICLFDSTGTISANRCTAEGICSLQKSQRPTCPAGQAPVCTVAQGWRCQ